MTEITEEMVEAAAEAAWRAEVSEIGAARRARESSLWADQQEAAKDKWRHLVRAALTAAFASRPSQGGKWVMVPREPTREQVEKLAQWWGYTVEEAAETYAVILDLTKDQSNG